MHVVSGSGLEAVKPVVTQLDSSQDTSPSSPHVAPSPSSVPTLSSSLGSVASPWGLGVPSSPGAGYRLSAFTSLRPGHPGTPTGRGPAGPTERSPAGSQSALGHNLIKGLSGSLTESDRTHPGVGGLSASQSGVLSGLQCGPQSGILSGLAGRQLGVAGLSGTQSEPLLGGFTRTQSNPLLSGAPQPDLTALTSSTCTTSLQLPSKGAALCFPSPSGLARTQPGGPLGGAAPGLGAGARGTDPPLPRPHPSLPPPPAVAHPTLSAVYHPTMLGAYPEFSLPPGLPPLCKCDRVAALLLIERGLVSTH